MAEQQQPGIPPLASRLVSAPGSHDQTPSTTNEIGLDPLSPPSCCAPADVTGTSRLKRKSSLDLKHVRQRAYGFDDLSRYGRKDRIVIKAADLLLTWLLFMIGITMRWQAHGSEHLDSILKTGSRVIFVFWHVCTLTSCWFWQNRGVVIMSSRSRDGEYTARFIKRYGYGTARGSSTRGSRRAMVELTECLASGVDAAFTIDGPKGPAYVAKDGAVTLARHTGCPILPFHIAVKRYLELPSWDRTQIPIPFSQAITLIGDPIWVSPRADQVEVAGKQAQMQAALDELCRMGEEWRQNPRQWKERQSRTGQGVVRRG